MADDQKRALFGALLTPQRVEGNLAPGLAVIYMAAGDRVSQLTERFEQAILRGEFAPGDRLPAERVLSARMGVSRTVVREALGRLASLGLVKSFHGSGTTVAAPNAKQVTVGYERLMRQSACRVEDLGAVRLPLETALAALAARHRTDEQLERMERTQAALADAALPLEAHAEADVEFHAVLAEASGNPIFAIVLAPIQDLLIESRRRTLGRYGAEIALRHHAKIIAAVRAGDSAAAVEAMSEHLNANTGHLAELADHSDLDADE